MSTKSDDSLLSLVDIKRVASAITADHARPLRYTI
jgi:hypothetical protein